MSGGNTNPSFPTNNSNHNYLYTLNNIISKNNLNSRNYIDAIAKTWNLRQIEGLSPDLLYKLEEDVYILFRMMMYHTLHRIKQKKDRNGIMDFVNHQIPDLNFKHSIQQRLITMMIKRMPHFFINFYYQYAQIVYKKNIRTWKKMPKRWQQLHNDS